ncbi:hypothetical protein [Agromyces archimandritae]|uniref:Lipoprotein n=1 Tax=Agromyces archimandritae TaxID=2781962 RepID=A0A975FKA0_9MICO|nr:hypothetical protein [Agromyces archimandritae]QTX03332.1 hypothetical protein G127AT_08020 [Agromyces archimandritae]
MVLKHRNAPRFALVAGVVGILVLSGCAESPGAVPKTRDLEPTSLSAGAEFLYECLAEFGWGDAVKLEWDGVEASSETIPDAQYEHFDADRSACMKRLDDRTAAMSPREVAEVYRHELETRECLIKQGYASSTPPSEQEFIDSYFSSPWMAYDDSGIDLARMPQDEWKQLNIACPQPSWALGGD